MMGGRCCWSEADAADRRISTLCKLAAFAAAAAAAALAAAEVLRLSGGGGGGEWKSPAGGCA